MWCYCLRSSLASESMMAARRPSHPVVLPTLLRMKKPTSGWARHMSPVSQTTTFGFQVLIRTFGALLIAIRIRTVPAQTIHINN